MADSVNNAINFIKKTFPETSLRIENNNFIFSGMFIIEAKKDDFIIKISPQLDVVINSKYPSVLPRVFDTCNYVKGFHKNYDNSLCLGTEVDIGLVLANSNIENYFNLFFFPYFLSYEYFKELNKPLYGERQHGAEGIFQSLEDIFNYHANDKYIFMYKLLLWASRKRKFHRVFNKQEDRNKAYKYINCIISLRKVGPQILRDTVRMIELEYKT